MRNQTFYQTWALFSALFVLCCAIACCMLAYYYLHNIHSLLPYMATIAIGTAYSMTICKSFRSIPIGSRLGVFFGLFEGSNFVGCFMNGTDYNHTLEYFANQDKENEFHACCRRSFLDGFFGDFVYYQWPFFNTVPVTTHILNLDIEPAKNVWTEDRVPLTVEFNCTLMFGISIDDLIKIVPKHALSDTRIFEQYMPSKCADLIHSAICGAMAGIRPANATLCLRGFTWAGGNRNICSNLASFKSSILYLLRTRTNSILLTSGILSPWPDSEKNDHGDSGTGSMNFHVNLGVIKPQSEALLDAMNRPAIAHNQARAIQIIGDAENEAVKSLVQDAGVSPDVAVWSNTIRQSAGDFAEGILSILKKKD